MKLTRRQAEFLRLTAELQAENLGDPVHYSELAGRLDVSKITAYNMLKVLEGKGCVSSRYHLPEIRIGRSSIVFEMTSTGRQRLNTFN